MIPNREFLQKYVEAAYHIERCNGDGQLDGIIDFLVYTRRGTVGNASGSHASPTVERVRFTQEAYPGLCRRLDWVAARWDQAATFVSFSVQQCETIQGRCMKAGLFCNDNDGGTDPCLVTFFEQRECQRRISRRNNPGQMQGI